MKRNFIMRAIPIILTVSVLTPLKMEAQARTAGLQISGVDEEDLTAGEAKVLDAADSALFNREPQFSYCYEKVLISDSSLATAELKLYFTVNKEGLVTKIHTQNSFAQAESLKSLRQCIKRVLRKIHFPKSKSDTDFDWNLSFRSESGNKSTGSSVH